MILSITSYHGSASSRDDGHRGSCSTSYIQRKLSVGYNKAAKLVEMMEAEGVVSQANHVGKREVLVPER